MSNIDLTWDNVAGRGDWRVSGGQLATGNLLATAVLISLFTDRVAPPGAPASGAMAADGSGDRRGWWMDSFDDKPIGSRLWQLRRRKIADRALLLTEARGMIAEALQWLLDDGLAASLDIAVSAPPADGGHRGTVLQFSVTLRESGGGAHVVRALWNPVG